MKSFITILNVRYAQSNSIQFHFPTNDSLALWLSLHNCSWNFDFLELYCWKTQENSTRQFSMSPRKKDLQGASVTKVFVHTLVSSWKDKLKDEPHRKESEIMLLHIFSLRVSNCGCRISVRYLCSLYNDVELVQLIFKSRQAVTLTIPTVLIYVWTCW